MKVPPVFFESDEEATEAIKTGKINPGDVIVIRYEIIERQSGNAGDAQSDFGDCRIRTRLQVALLQTDVSAARQEAHLSVMFLSEAAVELSLLVEEGDIITGLIFRIYL